MINRGGSRLVSRYRSFLLGFGALLMFGAGWLWWDFTGPETHRDLEFGEALAADLQGRPGRKDELQVSGAVDPGQAEASSLETGEPRRDAAEIDARALLVVNSQGAPIGGAEVSLHVMTNDVVGHFWTPAESALLAHIEERTERIVAEGAFGVARPDGGVEVEAGERLDAPEGWVLWVTAVGYEPAFRLGSGDEREWPTRVELRPCSVSTARVVDPTGGGVEGARVRVQGRLPAVPGAPNDLERLARRALVRSLETDTEGRCVLPGMGGPSFAVATRAKQRSRAVLRDGEEEVELKLAETFLLEAGLRFVDDTAFSEYAVVMVSVLQEGKGETLLGVLPCPSTGMGAEGVVLPEAGDRIVARLRFGDSEVSMRSVPLPKAGETVRVEFDVRASIHHWFQVLEYGDTEAGIIGAALRLSWTREGEEESWVHTRTAGDGWAQVRGLPIGVPVVPTVSGEGLAYRAFDPQGFGPESHEKGTTLEVERGGIVRARVMRSGQPVNGASFAVWDDGRPSSPEYFVDLEGENGWHDLAGLQRTLGAIVVIDEEHPLCRPVRLDHTDLDSATEVVLELGELAPLRGRAVDARTGEPRPGASVWLHAFTSTGAAVGVSMEPIKCDSEGRFETTYPESPTAGVHVYSESPSQAVNHVECELSADGSFDFGDVPLGAGFDLKVSLESLDVQTDWTGFHVRSGAHTESELRADFDADGRASLFVPLGGRAVTIHTPRRTALALRDKEGADEGVAFDIGLHVENSLWIEAVNERGEPVELGGSIVMRGMVNGYSVEAIAPISENGSRFAVPRPPMDRVVLRWRDPKGERATARGQFDLSGDGDVEVRWVIADDTTTVRIVDAQGISVPHVVVRLVLDSGGGSPEVFETADEAGIVELPGWGGLARAEMFGPGGSYAAIEPGSGVLESGSQVTWVFDPAHRLAVLCVHGDGPVSYPELQLRNGKGGGSVALGTGDAGGAFEFSELGAGDYVLRADAVGYFPRQVALRLPGSELEVQLSRCGALRAVVVDSDAEPVRDAELEFWSYEFEEGFDEWTSAGLLPRRVPRTGADGGFRFERLPAGSGAVRVKGGEWAGCEVPSGAEGSVRLVLD